MQTLCGLYLYDRKPLETKKKPSIMRLGHEGAVHSQSTLQPLEQRRSAFFYMPKKNGRRKSLVKHTKRNKQKWRI